MNTNYKKNNKGVTLIILSIMIIVLLILAGISINTGMDMIKTTKLEELRTNMLLIEAKAKEYVENANFKLGIKEEEKTQKIEIAKKELKGEPIDKPDYVISENSGSFVYYYKLTTEQLQEMGIMNVKSDSENGEYIVEYDINQAEVEVYDSKGIESQNQTYYSLKEIEKLSV